MTTMTAMTAINVTTFKKLYPNSKDAEAIVESLNSILPQYNINTPKRVALFISQCGHESGGWRVFEENLNYSAKALNIVFPKYFKRAGIDANEYHRKPEEIANVVYANRMGNNDTSSGDGWKYRGRGAIQITGFNNYNAFNEFQNECNSVENPELLVEIENAVLSAVWYWSENNLNQYADANDVKGATKRINGGYNGLNDRIKHYNKSIELFGEMSDMEFAEEFESGEVDEENFIEDFGLIRRGSKGEGVETIQELLGLKTDGIFGKSTERAVKLWQDANGLLADGIVGVKTLDKMLDDNIN